MTKGGGWRGLSVGRVLAAYLLVLQAALSGLALGAAPVAADAFTILCAPSAAAPSSSPENGRGGLPNCCLAGCLAHAGGMAPPPDLASSAKEPASGSTEATTPRSDAPIVESARTQHGARAPPARS